MRAPPACCVDESLYVRSAILGRLRQASYGGDTQMASLATGRAAARLQDDGELERARLCQVADVTKAPLKAPRRESRRRVLGAGVRRRGRFDGDGNAANVRRDLAGFFTGVDTRVGANGRARRRGRLYRLAQRARRPRVVECRDRTCLGLRRLERSATSICAPAARSRCTPSTPTARSCSRASSTRDREL